MGHGRAMAEPRRRDNRVIPRVRPSPFDVVSRLDENWVEPAMTVAIDRVANSGTCRGHRRFADVAARNGIHRAQQFDEIEGLGDVRGHSGSHAACDV